MKRTKLMLSTSLFGCLLAGQPAFAQDATAPQTTSPVEPSPVDDRALQEIIVTAERRTSTAQKTAASISVRSGADMLALGRYELKNILEDVPGISGGAAGAAGTAQAFGSDNPASGLTIRGIQSNAGAGGSITSTAAAAALYVDDVYNGIGSGYDIDRAEVLRGPQGTLYGRSATAGVVAIHTGEPDTSNFGLSGTGEVGNYNLHHVTGNLNIPVVKDKLAVRIAGNFYERDGYYSAEGGAVSNEAFRVKALWTPTDNFSALLGYAQDYTVTHTGGVAIDQVGSPTNFVYSDQAVSPAGKSHSHQYWGNFKLDLGAVAVTYIPAYRTWYQNGTTYLRGALNADQTIYTPNDWFMTHELRLANTDNAARFKWQAGVMSYQNKLDNVNDMLLVPNGPYAFRSSTHKETKAQGVFAEGTYSFTPETRLTVGGRYDHTEVLTTGEYTSVLGITESLTGNEGLRKFNNFTYKVRLEHDLTPQNMLYGVVSTGFSPGDVTLTTDNSYKPVAQTLKAETLTSYEIGSKNRFLDNRLQVNGDIYYNDYSGYQTAAINTSPQTPLTPTYATISLPLKSYGAELEVRLVPWANGTFSLNGSYTHARYGDFGEYAYLFSTHKVPGVAPFQGNLAYDHRIPIGEASLQLRGAIRFFSAHDTSSISVDWANSGAQPYVHVKSQAMGDLNATLRIGTFSLTAYVRNVTDRRFIPDGWGPTSVMANMTDPDGAPSVAANGSALSDPRTFGVIASFKY
ncbi:putative outer membrane salicin receptor [Novosphingobium sp. Rr 2-17]|uniref:TonB-dependent receptor n=1 Tax=Novosphingobium sp. Rr 2-17 TaxID=555793 RepID=UPI0002699B6B|nr:TonB-dependent receptor [Novosphingobium sp. Rr 2-17]EIZ80474.1 putative outer membrane salicin receptor [Novosphingobium sp. Rr 2-17]